MTGPNWRNAARGLLLAAMLAAAAPAFAGANLIKATDGYVYFNRPGADMATHDSELRNCLETWQGGDQPGRYTQGPIGGQGVLGDAIGAGVSNIMLGRIEQKRREINVEHCMVIRGWRVVRVPDPQGKWLEKADRKVLRDTLAPWVGAETPFGQIVRVWGNEAGIADTYMHGDPQGSSNKLLSSLAMDFDAPEPTQQVQIRPNSWLLPRNGITALPAGSIPAIPPGSALLVVRTTAAPEAKVIGLAFELAGEPSPGAAYRATFGTGVWKAPVVDGRAQAMQAFIVPAGKWRIYSRTSLFDFCMGAPAFEVKAGEVVYMGSFDFGPQPVKPDMAMAPALAFLGPDSPLAAKLRPAEWINGSTSLCRNWHPYALEFEGFPYEPGYVWGGAAGKPS